MVMDRATPRGKNVDDFFVALSLTHPMKDLAFSRCQSYLAATTIHSVMAFV